MNVVYRNDKGDKLYQEIRAAFGDKDHAGRVISSKLCAGEKAPDIRFSTTELMVRFLQLRPRSQELFIARILEFMAGAKLSCFEIEIHWGPSGARKILEVLKKTEHVEPVVAGFYAEQPVLELNLL
jgi:hypothetical protein